MDALQTTEELRRETVRLYAVLSQDLHATTAIQRTADYYHRDLLQRGLELVMDLIPDDAAVKRRLWMVRLFWGIDATRPHSPREISLRLGLDERQVSTDILRGTETLAELLDAKHKQFQFERALAYESRLTWDQEPSQLN